MRRLIFTFFSFFLIRTAGAQPLPREFSILPPAEAPSLRLESQVFSSYSYINSEGSSFNEFDLTRAELGAWLFPKSAFGGELRLEAIRSAGRESVMGIDRDSLVVRVKRAWAFARVSTKRVDLEGRLGLIPDPWIETIESVYDFRGIAQTLGQRAGFFDTSDLGVGLLLQAFEQRLIVSAAIQNGEGRNQIEQNNDKNITLVAKYRGFRFGTLGGQGTVHLVAGGRLGSVGAAGGRTHRMMGALTVSHPTYSAGLEYVRALGTEIEPARTSNSLGAWLSGYSSPYRTGVVLRGDFIDQTEGRGGDLETQITGGLYTDLVNVVPSRRVRLYVVSRWDKFGTNAAPSPGVPESADSLQFLALLSLHGQAVVGQK